MMEFLSNHYDDIHRRVCSQPLEAWAALAVIGHFQLGNHIFAEIWPKAGQQKLAVYYPIRPQDWAKGWKDAAGIMDFDKLKITAPYWTNDLPTDAGRWLQYTEGYVCTLLRGVVTFEGDQHTGARRGRLTSHPRAAPATGGRRR